MCKIWSYPQQVRVARFTSTQQQSDLHQHSTLIGKVHLLFSNQHSHFFLNLPFPCPLRPTFLPLTFNLKIQCLSQDMTIFSPQHITIPMNTVCHSQLIYGFVQTQHEHQIHRTFPVFELYSTHCSHHESSALCKIHISLLFRRYASLPYSVAAIT